MVFRFKKLNFDGCPAGIVALQRVLRFCWLPAEACLPLACPSLLSEHLGAFEVFRGAIRGRLLQEAQSFSYAAFLSAEANKKPIRVF